MLEFKSKRSRWLATLALLIAPFTWCTPGHADASDVFSYPPELEPDVRFWIRVYTEVTTEQGLLHDAWYLGLVYEVLRFDPADSPRQRERIVEQAKTRYAALLRRFAAGDTDNLTEHERRILHAFGEKTTPAEFREAIERIRFQLGQADRFHEGLIRAQAYEASISRVLADRGVPPEIGALPHVESSFNPAAYSRVGAAGLWQFMPGTARRYMRVDGVVDQRLDPYSATEAAANLMLYNYRLLGSWPLAVTAYNHGPGGLRHAEDELGTSNIAVIVKRYQGATFGFASRNFYVAFLAALEVDRNAEKYFGPLTHPPETQSTVVTMPDYVPRRCARPGLQSRSGCAARVKSGTAARRCGINRASCRAAMRYGYRARRSPPILPPRGRASPRRNAMWRRGMTACTGRAAARRWRALPRPAASR